MDHDIISRLETAKSLMDLDEEGAEEAALMVEWAEIEKTYCTSCELPVDCDDCPYLK